jgi:hypothetical protein
MIQPDWAQEGGGNGGVEGGGGGEGGGGDNVNVNVNTSDSFFYGAQHVLILVDCSPSMFKPCIPSTAIHGDEYDGYGDDNEDEEIPSEKNDDNNDLNKKEEHKERSKSQSSSSKLLTPFDVALLATERLLRRRIQYVATSKAGKRDGVGVLLFSTKRHQEFAGHDHLATAHVLVPLGPPGIDQVKDIHKCLPPSLIRSNANDNAASSSSADDWDDSKSPSQDSSTLLFGSSSILLPRPLKKAKKEESQESAATFNDAAAHGDDVDIGSSLAAARTMREKPHTQRIADAQTDVRHQREHDLQKEYEDVGYESRITSDAAASLGHATLCPLRIALQRANKIYRDASCVKKATASSLSNKVPRDTKSIWIFTNDDDPAQGNKEEQERIKVAAKDANDNGLELCLWPLPIPLPPKSASSQEEVAQSTCNTGEGTHTRTHNNIHFDKNKLYHSIISTQEDDGEDGKISDESSFTLESFLQRVNQQWKRHRRAFAVPFLLPSPEHTLDSVQQSIALDMYRFTQPQRKPPAFTVHQRTNQ